MVYECLHVFHKHFLQMLTSAWCPHVKMEVHVQIWLTALHVNVRMDILVMTAP